MRGRRGYQLAKRYGITLDDFDAMLAAQGSKCAVCDVGLVLPGPGTVRAADATVDHCHRTGRLRDVLCARCNRILGAVDDNVDLLRKLVAYLKRHEAMPNSKKVPVTLPKAQRVVPPVPDPAYVTPTTDERRLGLVFTCFRCERAWPMHQRDPYSAQCKPCARATRRERKHLERHPEQRQRPTIVIGTVKYDRDDVLHGRVPPAAQIAIDRAVDRAVSGKAAEDLPTKLLLPRQKRGPER